MILYYKYHIIPKIIVSLQLENKHNYEIKNRNIKEIEQ